LVWYGFRLDERTYRLIKKVAKGREVDLADFMREFAKKELARLLYLSEEEKKSLGVKEKWKTMNKKEIKIDNINQKFPQ